MDDKSQQPTVEKEVKEKRSGNYIEKSKDQHARLSSTNYKTLKNYLRAMG